MMMVDGVCDAGFGEGVRAVRGVILGGDVE